MPCNVVAHARPHIQRNSFGNLFRMRMWKIFRGEITKFSSHSLSQDRLKVESLPSFFGKMTNIFTFLQATIRQLCLLIPRTLFPMLHWRRNASRWISPRHSSFISAHFASQTISCWCHANKIISAYDDVHEPVKKWAVRKAHETETVTVMEWNF